MNVLRSVRISIVTLCFLASLVWSWQSITISTWFRSGRNWLGRRAASGAPVVAAALQGHAKLDLPSENLPSDAFILPVHRERCMPRIFDLGDTFLTDLASAVVTKPLRSDVVGITKIRVKSSSGIQDPFDCTLSPNPLFRRHLVDSLLSDMSRLTRGNIIIGSSGTSKSVFQFVLLHHLLNNVTGK
jgi:hypothetical protein